MSLSFGAERIHTWAGAGGGLPSNQALRLHPCLSFGSAYLACSSTWEGQGHPAPAALAHVGEFTGPQHSCPRVTISNHCPLPVLDL